jgi:hypothetical protein
MCTTFLLRFRVDSSNMVCLASPEFEGFNVTSNTPLRTQPNTLTPVKISLRAIPAYAQE